MYSHIFWSGKVGYFAVASGRLFLFSQNKRQPVHEKVLLGLQLSFESAVHALFELHTQKNTAEDIS